MFGLVVRLGDAGTGAVPWLVNIGGPWVVLAFVVGRATPSRAPVAGVACLLAAVVGKYGLQVAQGEIAAGSLVVRVIAWGTAAVAIGATLGSAGARARRRARWPWVLLGTILAVEAGAFLVGVLHGESAELRYDGQPAATAVFSGELALAVACVLVAVLVRRRPPRPTRPAPA